MIILYSKEEFVDVSKVLNQLTFSESKGKLSWINLISLGKSLKDTRALAGLEVSKNTCGEPPARERSLVART